MFKKYQKFLSVTLVFIMICCASIISYSVEADDNANQFNQMIDSLIQTNDQPIETQKYTYQVVFGKPVIKEEISNDYTKQWEQSSLGYSINSNIVSYMATTLKQAGQNYNTMMKITAKTPIIVSFKHPAFNGAQYATHTKINVYHTVGTTVNTISTKDILATAVNENYFTPNSVTLKVGESAYWSYETSNEWAGTIDINPSVIIEDSVEKTDFSSVVNSEIQAKGDAIQKDDYSYQVVFGKVGVTEFKPNNFDTQWDLNAIGYDDGSGVKSYMSVALKQNSQFYNAMLKVTAKNPISVHFSHDAMSGIAGASHVRIRVYHVVDGMPQVISSVSLSSDSVQKDYYTPETIQLKSGESAYWSFETTNEYGLTTNLYPSLIVGAASVVSKDSLTINDMVAGTVIKNGESVNTEFVNYQLLTGSITNQIKMNNFVKDTGSGGWNDNWKSSYVQNGSDVTSIEVINDTNNPKCGKMYTAGAANIEDFNNAIIKLSVNKDCILNITHPVISALSWRGTHTKIEVILEKSGMATSKIGEMKVVSDEMVENSLGLDNLSLQQGDTLYYVYTSTNQYGSTLCFTPVFNFVSEDYVKPISESLNVDTLINGMFESNGKPMNSFYTSYQLTSGKIESEIEMNNITDSRSEYKAYQDTDTDENKKFKQAFIQSNLLQAAENYDAIFKLEAKENIVVNLSHPALQSWIASNGGFKIVVYSNSHYYTLSDMVISTDNKEANTYFGGCNNIYLLKGDILYLSMYTTNEWYFAADIIPQLNISPTSYTVVSGDINIDNSVNILDLVSLKKVISQSNSSVNIASSDINNSGSIDIMDMILLRKKLLGAISEKGLNYREDMINADQSNLPGVMYIAYEGQTWNGVDYKSGMQVLANMGVKCIRNGMFNQVLFPGDNVRNEEQIAVMHDIIAEANKYGIMVIATVTGNWNSEGYSENIMRRDLTPCSDYLKWLVKYQNMYKTMVNEFPEITYWEIENEPNLPGTYIGGDSYTMDDKAAIYTDMMYYASLGIHDANPNAVSMLGGLAEPQGITSLSSKNFLEKIYLNIESECSISKNADDYFQTVAWHPYTFYNFNCDSFVTANNETYQVIKDHEGKDKKVFFTEFGFSDGMVSQDKIAAWLPQMYTAIKERMPYVESVCYFRAFNDLNDLNWGAELSLTQYGLFYDPNPEHNDVLNGVTQTPGAPKPVAYAYQAMTGATGDLNLMIPESYK